MLNTGFILWTCYKYSIMLSRTVTDDALQKKLQHRIDNKTKPLGALGQLEEIALRVGLLQGTSHPVLCHPHIVVFAGDHGIARTGLVNPYPQAVTAQMVLNFIRGGAAINVFCRHNDLGLTVVDAGVNYVFDPEQVGDRLVSKKIGFGTHNYLEGSAMTDTETTKAIEAGKEVVDDLAARGCNCIGFGEMGIGNTSSASLIMSYITGIPVAECVGRGTGVDDEQLERKKVTLQQVYRLHEPTIGANPDTPTILRCVGGFEIAMLTGAYLRAAEGKMIIVVDGFISTAALLLARLSNPSILANCIFSHCSGESGHVKMLEWLGARPLLQLGMRLGEGTGAALAFPFIRAAVNFLEEMASFESAGVSKSGAA
jgi:nicotinate-nucleotide--dimethylbenzimidazole phosphoribosyltransferase